MRNFILIGFIILGLTSFSQTNRKVYLLDLTQKNSETNLSRYYSVEAMLDFIKVPYDKGTSINDIINYPIVITASRFVDNVLTPTEISTIQNYVQNGGILISSSLRESDLFAMFGISNSSSTDSLFFIDLDTLQQPNLFQYINDSLETRISLGRPSVINNFFTREYTALPSSQILGSYENNSPAVIKNSLGSGTTYLFGPDFRDIIYRNHTNQDLNAHRTYSNGFEPSSDVIMFLIRNIIREHIPHSVYPHTIPNTYKSVVLLTHDIDSRTAIDSMHSFSTYEQQNGIKGQYNITCRYHNDNWMSNFYVGANAKITQLLNDGHVIASHSVGHYPDFADFPFGQFGNTTANYSPFYNGSFTANGTILGELETSKNLLENDYPVTVKSFRAGHLAFPDSLIIGLDTLGYKFNSTYSANDILTGFPYYGYRKQKFTTTKSPVLEIPMTISDVFASNPINANNYLTKVQTWLDASIKYEANHSPINLLIHPNRQYKLIAQQDYLNGLPNTTVPYGFEDFGEFWKSRTSLNYNTSLNNSNDTLTVLFTSNVITEQSFLLDFNGLDTVLFFDSSNQPMQFNWMQWNSRQRLYYQGNPVGIDELYGDNKNIVNVYPNPTKNILNFNSKNNFSSILIYSITGKEIKSINLINNNRYILNVSDLTNGFYFYKIKIGKNIESGKFVIQR